MDLKSNTIKLQMPEVISLQESCIHLFGWFCVLQDNNEDVASVRNVRRQTVDIVIIALIKRNSVERANLNNIA